MRTVEAVPSRVVGVARFLLHHKGSEKRSVVEAMMSPISLGNAGDDDDAPVSTSRSGAMIYRVIEECIKMGLCSKDEDMLFLSPEVTAAFHKNRFDPEIMRVQLRRLILSENSSANRDIGQFMTWFLEQDPLTFGVGQERRVMLMGALRQQTGDEQLRVTNNSPADNFVYWSVYFGLAWKMSFGKAKDERVIPDPTSLLLQLAPDLLPLGEEVAVTSFLEQLAALCPVFSGSSWHDELRSKSFLPSREPQYLPPALSFSLRRLQERGALKLIARADAESRLLSASGAQTQTVSHLERAV